MILPLLALAAAPVTRIALPPARPGWFVCDAVDGPELVLAGAIDAQRQSVVTVIDRSSGRARTVRLTVGQADPGAGQIYFALRQGDQPIGAVHAVNPGMIGDGAADRPAAPPILGLTWGKRTIACRWLAHSRFLGADAQRTVVVTQGADGLTYRSFDYAHRGRVTQPDGVQRSNVPSLEITGGSALPHGRGYRFVNRGYVYTVLLPRSRGAARVEVARGGRTLLREPFDAFRADPGG